jgi:hypothetical protein
MKVTTQSVLEVIGKRGVIVGSVALGKSNPKDLDVVIRDRGYEQARNPVFTDLLAQFGDACDSEVVGHLVVWASPLLVEVFEGNGWPVDDPVKRKNQVSFRQARKKSIKRPVFGVEMFVIQL